MINRRKLETHAFLENLPLHHLRLHLKGHRFGHEEAIVERHQEQPSAAMKIWMNDTWK